MIPATVDRLAKANNSDDPASAPRISVVIPLYNEEESIPHLRTALHEALDSSGYSYEIIIVDDGSKDKSFRLLREWALQDDRLTVVRLRRNFGQTAAFSAGFDHARGEIVITMDADLQNDPADIPEMLKLLESHDCVAGVRRKRDDSFSKRISSRIANRVRGAILNDGIHDAGCTFRAIRREALEELPAFKAIHRFAPTIMKGRGFRVVEMLVNHRPRTRGVSKYGIGNRLWVGIRDMFGVRWFLSRTFEPSRGEELEG
jgi:glycosyltransferase involved in cell wall biosynthesis